MSHRIDLTLDCRDALQLAEFWKLALGYEDEPPPAPFGSREEWLAHHGVPAEEWSDGAWLYDPSGIGPRLSILKVPEPKIAKNRLHIDIRVSDASGSGQRWHTVRDEVNRLVAAGATVLHEFPWHHVVMADPEGNEFCVA
jgi:catechol 2,3-dioxygenase-like lactoylglutathione lyase family enzyme